jgi:hypothetical protein
MHEFDSFERRRTDRQPMEATGLADFAPDLKIVNIGPRGIEIETSERLMVGAEYDFQVQSRGDSVPVRGTVVWSRLDRTVHAHDGDILPIYQAGIEAASASIPGLERLLERSAAQLS